MTPAEWLCQLQANDALTWRRESLEVVMQGRRRREMAWANESTHQQLGVNQTHRPQSVSEDLYPFLR
jgi:hypothetical protein